MAPEKVRRSTLPAIAICWTLSASSAFAQSDANRARATANGSGSSIRDKLENASWLGRPCSRRMNRRRIAFFDDGEIHHVDASLPAARARKQRERQHLEKIVARYVALAGILVPSKN